MKKATFVIYLSLIAGLVVWCPPERSSGRSTSPVRRASAGDRPAAVSSNAAGEALGSPPPTPEPADPQVQAPAPFCPRCSLVLVSIDTLRADHLGCYGYRHDTSPNIDRLASESALFERAYAASYVTADSHMSIFTSLYPSVHGVKNVSARNRTVGRLHPGVKTLPEILQAEGYATAAITGGGNVAAGFGFDRGMDRFDVVWEIGAAVRQAKRFVERHREDPFFLFLHTYHAHDPYLPGRRARRFYPGEYRGKIVTEAAALRALQRDDCFEEARRAYWSLVNQDDPADMAYLVSLYDGEIWEVDRELGKLFEHLRRRVPNALIIVTSDHGEQFLEHGGILHNDLYQELLHVPLIIAGPGATGDGRRIRTPVSLVDLAPTALDLLGLPVPAWFQGRSLAAALNGKEPLARDIFSEKAGRKTAFLTLGSKLIVSVERLPELYDLDRDAEEKNDLAQDVPRVLGLARRLGQVVETNYALRTELRAGASTSEESKQLDSSTEEQLKALGYIE